MPKGKGWTILSGIQMINFCQVYSNDALKKPVYGPICLVIKRSAKSFDSHLYTGHLLSSVQMIIGLTGTC